MKLPSDRWLTERGGLLLLLLVLASLAAERHPYFGFDGIAAFGAVLGAAVALAAVALGWAAEALLRRGGEDGDE